MGERSMSDLLVVAQAKARRVAARILRHCPAAVDDVLQDAAVRALTTEAAFRGESEFSTWFTRIVINRALMYLRSEKPWRVVPIDEALRVESRLESPEQTVARRERDDRLISAVADLSPKLRDAALGMLLEVKTRSNTLKARRFRARAKLREILSEEAA